jgi:starch synthase
MKIWLPYIRGGSGVDVYTNLLAQGLRAQGAEAITQALPHALQYAPHLLRALRPPQGTKVIVTNCWNGFAFRRTGAKLVVIEHHCIFDPAYTPYRSRAQGIFHDLLVHRFEQASFDHADLVIAVSRYTANATAKAFPGVTPLTILNGIDTDFFCPGDRRRRTSGEIFRLLFVGNLTERKGADLLAPIMRELGSGFELHYTGGLRTKHVKPPTPNMHATGRLSNEALRQAYRDADALLFPTRLEGFGYAAAEAMSCGTPVIASNASAIPEVVDHGVTGLLCPVDDVQAFIKAAKTLKQDEALHNLMGTQARNSAAQRFRLAAMSEAYASELAALKFGSPSRNR